MTGVIVENFDKKKNLKGTRILFCGRGRPNNIFHSTKLVLTLNSTLYFLSYFSAQYPKRYNYLNTLNVFFFIYFSTLTGNWYHEF